MIRRTRREAGQMRFDEDRGIVPAFDERLGVARIPQWQSFGSTQSG